MYKIFEYNPQLKPFSYDIAFRMHRYKITKWRLLDNKISLSDFASAYDYFGIHHTDKGWVYREWAPSAHQLYLTGDFNNWNWTEHPMKRLDNGIWELELPENKLKAGSKLKLLLMQITLVQNTFHFTHEGWFKTKIHIFGQLKLLMIRKNSDGQIKILYPKIHYIYTKLMLVWLKKTAKLVLTASLQI